MPAVTPKLEKKNTKKVISKAPKEIDQDLENDASEARLRCTIAWVDKKCTKAGIKFSRLSDIQRKGIEDLLRATIGD